jgi:hypothetical protein
MTEMTGRGSLGAGSVASAEALITDPHLAALLADVAGRMHVTPAQALGQALQTMIALYDSKAAGGRPVVRYRGAEQPINLPGT